MLTAGIDIGSRSAQCVILDDGELITYGNIETGPESAKTAYATFDAAIHRSDELWGKYRLKLPDIKTDHIKIEDMAYIVATGYGRVIVPFANANITEISCHAKGAVRFVPGVSTILDMGGQDCKGIRVDEKGNVTNFIMNDKCAGGTGRFMEIISDILQVPLTEIGPISMKSTEKIPFNTICAVFAKSEAVALLKKGTSKADILSGLHEAISSRVIALLKRVGIEEKFVITGGIAKNIGVVSKVEEKAGIKTTIPDEPQIAGAMGAAIFALERAKKQAAGK
jgi:benzoyl-CoA reductase subunit A